MADLKKTIEKLSGYKGPTLKTLIPESKPAISKTSYIKQILDIKKRKTELYKTVIESQKILFRRAKKRSKKLKKFLVRNTSKIPIISKIKFKKIGDSKRPVRFRLFDKQTIKSPTVLAIPAHSITPAEQVIWIKLSPKGKEELRSALLFGNNFYKARVDDIVSELNSIYLKLIALASQLVSKHVPRDTGDLRNSLIASMSSRSTKKPPTHVRRNDQIELRVGFYTNLPYLKYVDKPKRQITVRHHRNEGIISYRGGRHYLHDPTAKTTFMLTTKQAIRNEAQRLTKQFIRNLWNKWKPLYTYNKVKAQFRYPGMRAF